MDGIFRRLFTSLELDPSAALATGWQPPQPQAQGFAETMAAL
jgi:hypothetical protein